MVKYQRVQGPSQAKRTPVTQHLGFEVRKRIDSYTVWTHLVPDLKTVSLGDNLLLYSGCNCSRLKHTVGYSYVTLNSEETTSQKTDI